MRNKRAMPLDLESARPGTRALVFCLVFLMCARGITACVGGEDAGSGGSSDAASPGDATGGSDSNLGVDSNTGADATSDTSTNSDASSDTPVDASTEADAGPPSITCLAEGLTGFYFFRPSAAIDSTAPGGSVQLGDYHLYRYWGPAPGGFAGGTATFFQQGSDFFLRFYENFAIDGGAPTYGTRWMQLDGSGNLTMTELCDSVTKGTVRTATYEMRTSVTPNVLVITYSGATRQEEWQRQ